jgi:hypothetical protein
MRTFGTSVLTDLHQKNFNKKPKKDSFKFGFHLPPLISVHHIHLHAFILPFKNSFVEKYKYSYGPIFKSVDQIYEMLSQQQPKL